MGVGTEWRQFGRAGAALVLALGFLACGGGGGGNGSNAPTLVPPAVTTQPQDVTGVEAHSVTFAVAASGSPAPQCQWERSGDTGTTWTSVPGATSLTYTLVAQDQDHGAQFRARLTNSAGSVITQAATLTVHTLPSFLTQPADLTVLAGQGAAFAGSVKGRPVPTLAWERSSDGGQTWAVVTGESTASWTFATREQDNGIQIRLVASNAVGRMESQAAHLWVNTAPRMTSDPASLVVTTGQLAVFTAAAQGQPLPSLQWQQSLDGGNTWMDLAGQTGSTLQVDSQSLTQTSLFRMVATNVVARVFGHSASLKLIAPRRLAAGMDHATVIRTDGSVWSWGQHNLVASGELGQVAGSPTQAPGLSGAISLSCGVQRTRVVMKDGTLWGWGGGERGSGFAPTSTIPVRLFDLDRVAKAAGGFFHSLALRMDGTVWAWGMNNDGQLGDGTTDIRMTPFQVPGLSNIVDVAAGADYSMALDAGGSVWVWGRAGVSSANGSGPDPRVPRKLAGLSNIRSLACGYGVAMAVEESGAVWAWGSNSTGQLGDMSIPGYEEPTRFPWMDGMKGIALGSAHTLLLDASGSLLALGGNFSGQIGDGTRTTRAIPVPVVGLTTVRDVTAGGNFSVAQTEDGALWAWGSNWVEELGEGGSAVLRAPTPIPGVGPVQDVTVGMSFSMALATDGTVWTWGTNLRGQLGDGTTQDRTTPAQVPGLGTVVALAAGNHGLALKADGTVWAWGDNGVGQLGQAQDWNPHPNPTQVSGLSGVTALAAGFNHSLALKSDGTVWSWGGNANGCLGDGTQQANAVPKMIPGLSGITKIWARNNASFALDASGAIWAWGWNWVGQLGDGTLVDRVTPVQLAGLPAMNTLAAGWGFAMAIDAAGSLWSWGDNGAGQLGDGTVSGPRPTPTKVVGFPVVTALAAGDQTGFAIKPDGTVLAWGANYRGEMGGGTWTYRALPTQVDGLTGAVRMNAMGSTVLATAGSSPFAWGSDYFGGLGQGRKLCSLAPVRVTGL